MRQAVPACASTVPTELTSARTAYERARDGPARQDQRPSHPGRPDRQAAGRPPPARPQLRPLPPMTEPQPDQTPPRGLRRRLLGFILHPELSAEQVQATWPDGYILVSREGDVALLAAGVAGAEEKAKTDAIAKLESELEVARGELKGLEAKQAELEKAKSKAAASTTTTATTPDDGASGGAYEQW